MFELCMSGQALRILRRSSLAQTMKAFMGRLMCGLLDSRSRSMPLPADDGLWGPAFGLFWPPVPPPPPGTLLALLPLRLSRLNLDERTNRILSSSLVELDGFPPIRCEWCGWCWAGSGGDVHIRQADRKSGGSSTIRGPQSPPTEACDGDGPDGQIEALPFIWPYGEGRKERGIPRMELFKWRLFLL